MGTDRNAAYVADVAYVRQFCPELTPSVLRAVAALSGCPPPAGDDFDFAEFGSGLGDTLTTLAAAHPRARFVGIDVNPTHVAGARALAARGAVANVRFVESDFETLAAGELPPLDYLAAHGLIAWIPADKRRALFASASARLKPGGLLYLGYSALPGWAGVAPLRRFMLDAAASVEGDLEARVRHALAAAHSLAEAGAAYFAAHPFAKEILAIMVDMGVPYVAHEFFGAHWEPLYFADVAAQAAEHDLRFVGQLPLHLNYRDLSVAPSVKAALGTVPDRRALERLGGFANNESFRRDVYVKGAVAGGGDTARAYLEATPFGTLVPGDEVARELVLPGASLRFQGPLFEAVIAGLAHGACAVSALAETPALAPFGHDAVRQAVLQLAMGKDVTPMTRSSAPSLDPGARLGVTSAFNRAVLAEPMTARRRVVLASPVAGTGVGMSALHAVALRALTESAHDGRDAWLRALVESTPLRLVEHGRPVVDKSDLTRLLAAQVEQYRVTRVPKLVELGVLGPLDAG
jgi:SAM-dependent methyltransferase